MISNWAAARPPVESSRAGANPNQALTVVVSGVPGDVKRHERDGKLHSGFSCCLFFLVSVGGTGCGWCGLSVLFYGALASLEMEKNKNKNK